MENEFDFNKIKTDLEKNLEELTSQGWEYIITPVNPTYWIERRGSAKDFFDELLILQGTAVHVEWVQRGRNAT